MFIIQCALLRGGRHKKKGAEAPFSGLPLVDALCGLPARIRKINDEAGLEAIEDEVDGIIRTQLFKSAGSDESASETQALIAAAHRVDNLIHHRRTVLAAKTSVQPSFQPPVPMYDLRS
jgi:hypothetical protein